ncbi:MAG: PTS-dependent dihydroxyacetone kinase phosphotransferase subunit DhaM [Synergistes sp.]|nr:PTS-dependent dihydroxyacetone kinase phosphotransferase subunit DhaM [Synergistes sp.]
MVVVSHSDTLAKGVVELAGLMAADAPLAAAGGLDDGTFGTSYEKISNAIDKVNQGDGVVVLMDMGSAVMTAEMVIEDKADDKIKMVDCPLVEGAVAAAVTISCGDDLEAVIKAAEDVREDRKF